jgi:hypothetical protein
MTKTYSASETLSQNNFMGGHPPLTKPVTLASSGTERELVAGTVLGKVTASGKHDQCIVANADGTETADLILAETVTVPAAGDEQSVAYRHGEFRESGLTYDPAATAAEIVAINDTLEAKGIYVK